MKFTYCVEIEHLTFTIVFKYDTLNNFHNHIVRFLYKEVRQIEYIENNFLDKEYILNES